MKKTLTPKYILTIIAIMLVMVFTNKVKASTGTVTTETLNLRKEASTNSSVLALINADEKVEIISEEGNWYKVAYKDKEGYVSKDYIKVDEEKNTTNKPDEPNTTEPNNEAESNQNTNITSNTTIKLEKDVTIKILPLINSNNLGTAKNGEEITVITTANNWMFIQTESIAGWIVKDTTLGQATTPVNDEKNDETENKDDSQDSNTNNGKNTDNNENTDNAIKETNYDEAKTKYINASSVYVRSEPSTSASIVTSLIRNTDVEVVGEVENWYKVKFGNYNGYIYKELLSDSKIEETNRGTSNRDTALTVSSQETSNLGEEIANYAKQYLGCPYVYGASGSQSFDCSGFTMYVYKHFGYSLSHSAIAQSNNGTYVAKEDLQPGDLVFFLDYETMDGIGHCGIYIGNGEFIHASSGSGYCVKISTLESGSYCNRYSTARRLI